MGKADIKKLQKERALLNAAYSLFLKNGIKKTSITDITEKAGVAKGTFYLYFTDKYDIRDKLVASKAADVFNNAFKAMQKSPVANGEIEDILLFLLENSVDQLCANRRLLHFIATNIEWPVLGRAIVRKEDNGEISVLDAYRNLVMEVQHRYRNVEIMLFMIIELIFSTTYNVTVHSSPVTIEELKPELFGSIRAIMNNYRIS